MNEMLSDRHAAYLRYFESLASQAGNRWSGFDQSAPDARQTELRAQILFVGCALAALATHPSASPDEQARCLHGLAALADRLIQRRVWATWAAAAEQAGRKPDPIDIGNAAYSGALAMLVGLHAVLSGAPLYGDEPFTLHWSSHARFSYSYGELVELLWRQMRASPDGGVACADNLAHPACMAQVLWATRLHDQACGGNYTEANGRWLATLRDRLALRGPRLPGRGVFAATYQLRQRRAGLTSDDLEDAWSLALLAPLDQELARSLAARHWPTMGRLRERGPALPLAFSYLLAVELGAEDQAAALLASIETRFQPQEDDEGRRYDNSPWLTAIIAIGEAGGLGRVLIARPNHPDERA